MNGNNHVRELMGLRSYLWQPVSRFQRVRLLNWLEIAAMGIRRAGQSLWGRSYTE
jgi:hypothetical protein